MSDPLGIVLHNQLNEQQDCFAKAVAAGWSPIDAARQAGYPETSVGSTSTRLMQTPHILAYIQIQAARELLQGAPGAIKLLRRFVSEEDKWDPKIRLAAANSLLNRAGFIAPKAVERAGEAGKGLNEMTMDELRAERDKLEGEIAGRAKPVSSAKAAPQDTQAIDDII